MEAVGAVASIIAICQATQTLVQFGVYLRSLRGLGSQAEALDLELQYFQIYSAELKETADFLTSTADEGGSNNVGAVSDLHAELIAATDKEMQLFVEAAQDFQKSCEKLKPTAENKPAKIAWYKLIPKKNDIQTLRERAQLVRPRFLDTISVISAYYQRRQTRLLLNLTAILHSRQSHITSLPSNQNASPHLAIEESSSTTEELSSQAAQQLATPGLRNRRRQRKAHNRGGGTDPRSAQAQENRRFVGELRSSPIFSNQAGSSANWKSRPGDDMFENDESILELQAQLIAECLPSCRCACHVRRTDIAYDFGKAWSVLQGCVFQYSSAPLVSRAACTYAPCKRSRKSTVAVSLRIPTWFCSKTVNVRTSVDSLSSVGSRLCFMVGREIPIIVHGHIRNKDVQGLKDWVGEHGPIYPWDIDYAGRALQNLRIDNSVLGFLIRLWAPLLRSSRLDRGVFFGDAYHRHLAYQRGKLHAVLAIDETLIKYDENPPTFKNTRSHAAIRNQDLDELTRALEQDPMETQIYDFDGYTPINLAADMGDVGALFTLLKFGASIDQTSLSKETPLCLAAWNNRLAFVKALVNLGCDIDRRSSPIFNYYGRNACWLAAEIPTHESIEMFEIIFKRHTKILMETVIGICSCRNPPIARAKFDIIVQHRKKNENAFDAFKHFPALCTMENNTRLLKYIFHKIRDMEGGRSHQIKYDCDVLRHLLMRRSRPSESIRIWSRQCPSWLCTLPFWKTELASYGNISQTREVVGLSLAIRNRTLDGLICSIRAFLDRVIVPRASDDGGYQEMKRLIKNAPFDNFGPRRQPLSEGHPCAESQKTFYGLSESLRSIWRSLNKSNWDEAEEATRIILGKLEDIRSSDIWLIFKYLVQHADGSFSGVPFERDEIWDINFDEEEGDEHDSGGQEVVPEECERENPWIGTEIRYVRL